MQSVHSSTQAATDAAPISSFFFGWWVVLCGFVGLAFGTTALLFFAFGIFITPLSAEFGWSVTQITVAITLVSYVIVIISPIQGFLLDRFGVRRVVLPSTVLFGTGFSLMYYVPPNIYAFYAAFILLPIVGLGLFPASYAKAAAGWFDQRLGLAVGIVSAGGGIGAAILPSYGQFLIGEFGWRIAYLALGMTSFILTFPLAYLVLYGDASHKGHAKDGQPVGAAAARSSDHGYAISDGLQQRDFWLIAGVLVLLGAVTTGILTNQVPMLIEKGLEPHRAALVQSVFGIALIVGRLLCGYLLDRFFAPHVMMAFLMGPIAALAIYATAPATDIVFLCSALIGLAVGAEFDVLAYFTGRYFGRRAYGKFYAAFYAMFMLGAGLGAVTFALARSSFGGYEPGLWAFGGITTLALGLLALLGPYPQFDCSGHRSSR